MPCSSRSPCSRWPRSARRTGRTCPSTAVDEALGDRRRCLVSLDADAGDTLAVAFLPPIDGRQTSVAVGYFDGTVRIWDLAHFDRHVDGQVAYQRALREGTAPWPTGGPK